MSESVMQTEWEATFWPVDKDEMRARLKAVEATLIYSERLMRRVNFHPPEGGIENAWVRVRDEGDKITLSIKQSGTEIAEQKERQLVIDNFDEGVELLLSLGCQKKNYQETRRELWKLQGAEITIDEWPFLEPLVEIEGPSEELVRDVSEKLGLDWSKAEFCSIDKLYAKHYKVHPHKITRETPVLVFEGENPFV